MAQRHATATHLVYEDERYTFKETFEHAARAASVFRDVYGVHKGDRVAVVMRNYPQVRPSDPSSGPSPADQFTDVFHTNTNQHPRLNYRARQRRTASAAPITGGPGNVE